MSFHNLAYADLSGCTKHDYTVPDVIRMDYSSAEETNKPFMVHPKFTVSVAHDEETGDVVYNLRFTEEARRLICYEPFDSATAAVLSGLREIGDIK
jgi:hypothetical protein